MFETKLKYILIDLDSKNRVEINWIFIEHSIMERR